MTGTRTRRHPLLRLMDRPAFDRLRNRRARRALVVANLLIIAGWIAVWARWGMSETPVPQLYLLVAVLPAAFLLSAAASGADSYSHQLDEVQRMLRDAAYRRFHPVSGALTAVLLLGVAPAALADGVAEPIAWAAALALLVAWLAPPTLLLAWTLPDEGSDPPADIVPGNATTPRSPAEAGPWLARVERWPVGRLLQRPPVRQLVVTAHAVMTLALAFAALSEPAYVPALAAVWLALSAALVLASGGIPWAGDRVIDERLRGVRDRAYLRAHLTAVVWPLVGLFLAAPQALPAGVTAGALFAVGAYATATLLAMPTYVLVWTMPATREGA